MLYLALAIISSSSIALIFKHSETINLNRYAVTTANYVMAVLIALGFQMLGGLPVFDGLSIVAGLQEISVALRSSGKAMSTSGAVMWAVLVGIAAGSVFMAAFIYYQKSIRSQGVGLAGAFAKLGILVPMSLSLVFWQEIPTEIQWLGIVLAITSIVLVNIKVTEKLSQTFRPALMLLFLFGGLAEFSNKVFQKYGVLGYKNLFLLVTFFVAGVISLVITWRKDLPVTARDIRVGLLVGIPNLFSSFFLIEALHVMKAAVVFPVFAAGTIVVINVVGILFFGERLTAREKTAVGLTIIALVLINL